MAHLTIYRETTPDSTVVSNLFIDEYMRDANDAQLKVYFYLLRMMGARQATSVSDIADKFNHTEKDVLRALKYWQGLKLLDLDYDNAKNLVGIHIRDLSAGREISSSSFVPAPAVTPSASSRPSGAVPSDAAAADAAHLQFEAAAAESALRQSDAVAAGITATDVALRRPDAVAAGTAAADTSSQSLSAPAEASAPAETVPSYKKPSYSADRLKAFRDRAETAQLLFIAESYIGRPLTPPEMKTILYFIDVLHFSDDLIDYLIQYCVDKGKKDFKYIEKVAVNWAEEGITTPAQAQKQARRYDKNVYTVMNGLGKSGSPTKKEVEYISRWIKEYGFSTDVILEACERTVLATDKHRFEYAEGILSSWKRQNVHHKSDISRVDDAYRQRQKPAAAPKSANRFNQFTQNSYDFEALEAELISN